MFHKFASNFPLPEAIYIALPPSKYMASLTSLVPSQVGEASGVTHTGWQGCHSPQTSHTTLTLCRPLVIVKIGTH